MWPPRSKTTFSTFFESSRSAIAFPTISADARLAPPLLTSFSSVVAADTSVLRFGTKLVIPGYATERPVEVLDRGGAIKGNRLDVFFPTHAEALKWGRQKVEVVVVE